MHSTRIRARYLALLTAVSLVSPAVAQAGPDDGKVLGTAEHIDAPKVYWDNGNFDLRMKASTPLQEAVLWVGRGYHERTGDQNYQFMLPANGTMNDVGTPGEVFYTAPRNPGWNHAPIWWGYGADAGLPTDDFRDGTASLDLLSVEGPGDVELFADYGREAGPKRLLGTLPNSPKSILLHKGMHMHNSTLFTKPGRYVLTYGTSARDNEGKIIDSAPQQLAVQVGGRAPLAEKSVSTNERYDAAATGATEGYRVSVAPKKAVEKAGDEHLHTIEFSAPGAGDGTLTLFNEGYFLTDLPVTGGKATWDEMFGPLGGNIQAVFTPAAGQPGARWISAPVTVAPGKDAATSDAAADWKDLTGTARTLQETSEVNVADDNVTVRLERTADKVLTVTADADPNFSGFVTGGLYEGDAQAASQDIAVNVVNGHGEARIPLSEWMLGTAAKVSVLPHPRVNAGRADIELAQKLDLSQPVVGKGRLGEGASASVTPEPQRCGERLVLDQGHVDLKAARNGDALAVALKDETGLHEQGVVDRALDTVQLNVGDNALVTREGALADDALDFTGAVGERFYLLPQAQKQDIVWPGYNTQDLDYSQFDGTVDLHVTPRSMPEGASFGLFQYGSLGEADVLIDSTTKDFVVETSYPAHAHANWAFSKPGIYELEVSYTAKGKDGKAVESAPQVLRVAVGNAAAAECEAAPAPDPTSKPGSADKGSSASPWTWLGPLLGVGLIGALVAAAKDVPAVKKVLAMWGIRI